MGVCSVHKAKSVRRRSWTCAWILGVRTPICPPDNRCRNCNHTMKSQGGTNSQPCRCEVRHSRREHNVGRFKRRRDSAGDEGEHHMAMSAGGLREAYGWANLLAGKVGERKRNQNNSKAHRGT